jgi:hypothetical protein
VPNSRDHPLSNRHVEISTKVSGLGDPLTAAREAYRRRLIVLADQLQSSCFRAEDNPEAPATLRRLAHRLTGTAGSYGFHEISAAAERLAQVLEDSAPWPRITERADRLIGLMRGAEASVADKQ